MMTLRETVMMTPMPTPSSTGLPMHVPDTLTGSPWFWPIVLAVFILIVGLALGRRHE